MKMMMDNSGAPSFLGRTPPDRVEMSLDDYLSGALNVMRAGPLTPDQQMSLRAFYEATAQIIAEQTGQPGGPGPGMQQQAPPMPSEETSQYGTGPGTSDVQFPFG
jgi:hypothetical protein